MTALQKIEPAGEVADYGASLLEVISRAASDPNVDIDKMERLIAMQERVQDRRAEVSYHASLAEMQPELPIITENGGIKNKEGKVQSTYALWEDINEEIRPILAKYGFSLSFKGQRQNDQQITIGILAHREGHKETTEVSLPLDTSGSKNAVQAVGSSKSYGKRYAAFDLLNITTRGEDDDGAKAGTSHPISVKQYDELLREISRVGSTTEEFVAFLKTQKKLATDDLGDLPDRFFEYAKGKLAGRASK